jgi:hypothetical protein
LRVRCGAAPRSWRWMAVGGGGRRGGHDRSRSFRPRGDFDGRGHSDVARHVGDARSLAPRRRSQQDAVVLRGLADRWHRRHLLVVQGPQEGVGPRTRTPAYARLLPGARHWHLAVVGWFAVGRSSAGTAVVDTAGGQSSAATSDVPWLGPDTTGRSRMPAPGACDGGGTFPRAHASSELDEPVRASQKRVGKCYFAIDLTMSVRRDEGEPRRS